MCSGQYEGDDVKNYYTPSSFCWGDSCDDDETRKDSGNIELSGIWIAKFEISGTIDDITSLPNKSGLFDKSVSTYFTKIQDNMNGTNGLNNYGFNGNYDTHMINNTEWGAFSYLSQSKYGNQVYKGINKEIYHNGYFYLTSTRTGCSHGSSNGSRGTTCQYYNFNGQGASTSDFIVFHSQRYYTLYINETSIKGDAINADGTAGFYNDGMSFITISTPWFLRGGSYNVGGQSRGVFAFDGYYGKDPSNLSNKNSTRFAIVTW